MSNDRSFDLSPIWSVVETLAEVYEGRRRGLDSTRPWRGDYSTHLPGLAGQIGVALITGKPTFVGLLAGGDGGTDIGEVDIKTATYWPPILKHPVGSERWPKWFGLAHISQEHVVTFIGAVKAGDLTGPLSYIRCFNEAAGPQHCLDDQRVRDLYRAYLSRKQ